MTIDQVTNHIKIFYIDRRTGWAIAAFDSEENQIGEAAYIYRKRDAKIYAQRFFSNIPIQEYKRN